MKPQRIHVSDPNIMRIQSAIADAINKWPDFFYTAQLIGPFNLITGDNVLSHGLEQTLQGWIVVRRNTGAVIFDKQSANRVPEKTLILNASTNVTVSLVVF